MRNLGVWKFAAMILGGALFTITPLYADTSHGPSLTNMAENFGSSIVKAPGEVFLDVSDYYADDLAVGLFTKSDVPTEMGPGPSEWRHELIGFFMVQPNCLHGRRDYEIWVSKKTGGVFESMGESYRIVPPEPGQCRYITSPAPNSGQTPPAGSPITAAESSTLLLLTLGLATVSGFAVLAKK
jgi:hypothetical protein